AQGQADRQANRETSALTGHRMYRQGATELSDGGICDIHAHTTACILGQTLRRTETGLENESGQLVIAQPLARDDHIPLFGLLANRVEIQSSSIVRNFDQQLCRFAAQGYPDGSPNSLV